MKRAIFALFKASVPRLDYYATYRARVVQFNDADQTIDVVPDDQRIPSMGGIPFRHGAPGTTVKMPIVNPGTSVLIGWSGGDPSAPFAESWGGGETVAQITQVAAEIILGGTGAQPTLKGTSHNSALSTLAGALTVYTTAIQGVADPANIATPIVQAAITQFLSALPTTLATKVKVV